MGALITTYLLIRFAWLLWFEETDSKCYLSECSDCPGITKIKDILQEAFDKSEINEITFKQ